MDFEKVEKAMYKDEEFIKFLPLLKEEYWKKATPKQRLKFFEELQRVIHGQEELFPVKVTPVEWDDAYMQSVIMTEDEVLMDERLLKKTFNPYSLFSNYIFELQLVNNIMLAENEEFIKTEKGRRININVQESMLGDWDNFYDRRTEEFYYQPIVRDSVKVSTSMTYRLLKYMNKKYGMDRFVGEKVSGLMLSSFQDYKEDERVEKNFKVMEENAIKGIEEKKKLDSFFDSMNDADLSLLSDEEFFGFFNEKILNICNEETLCYLFGQFTERMLRGYKDLDKVIESIIVGESEEYGKFIQFGDNLIGIQSFKDAFYNLFIYICNLKLYHNLCTEIPDKKFLDDAKLCYEYINELKDDDGCVTCNYLSNAYSYYEYRNKMIDIYYKKFAQAISKNKYYNEGNPYLYRADFSRYEAYLNFAFNMDFETVKKLQFDELETAYSKKIGGGK